MKPFVLNDDYDAPDYRNSTAYKEHAARVLEVVGQSAKPLTVREIKARLGKHLNERRWADTLDDLLFTDKIKEVGSVVGRSEFVVGDDKFRTTKANADFMRSSLPNKERANVPDFVWGEKVR